MRSKRATAFQEYSRPHSTQEVTFVEKQVGELKERVCCLMIAIVNTLHPDSSDVEQVNKASEDIRSEIEDLESLVNILSFLSLRTEDLYFQQ